MDRARVFQHAPATHLEYRGGAKDSDNTTGGKLPPAEMKTRALGLTKTKGKTTPEYQWDVSNPDLDPAEHTVGGVCDKTQISAGFYNHAELKENTKKRWKNYAQARFGGPVGGMPN